MISSGWYFSIKVFDFTENSYISEGYEVVLSIVNVLFDWCISISVSGKFSHGKYKKGNLVLKGKLREGFIQFSSVI